MEKYINELKSRLIEINDLNSAVAVLIWDQNTYMPSGGAIARGRQIATLRRLSHERFTDEGLGKLLELLKPYEQSLPFDHVDASLIRITRRDYQRSVHVPPTLVAELATHGAASYNAWKRARPANDVQTMIPYLERTLELSQRVAECFPGYEHMADPLIDFADYGLKASFVRQLFAQLRTHLVPLVQAITAQPAFDDTCLHRHYPESLQKAFGEKIIRQFGYDFTRGRQDKTAHPFATRFSAGDIRITTRFDEHHISKGLFSTLHESGHAMYEQGINPDYDGTLLARGTSSSVHESQARLWENLVGRSRAFWKYYYPQLQKIFPKQLGDISLENFYQSINKVKSSLIRTDADEVTYNLHIMVRFDLELAMLEGGLAVRDLPEAWNERYKTDLGLIPDNHTDGVLQDVHWFASYIGGTFQGYTLGNILSAQFLNAARAMHPTIDDEIECGEFGKLHHWLREHIYIHGSKFTTTELVKQVTGTGIEVEPYVTHLTRRYKELYKV